jgi:nicotinamide riboside transporter PnuC
MDWLGALLIIISVYLTGKKNKWGWVVAGVGAIVFIVIALNKHIYGMIALDCVLIMMYIRSFIKWNKSDKYETSRRYR